MTPRTTPWLLAALLFFTTAAARAADLLMVRSPEPFPEAMATLQEAIREAGYTVSRVQRVDVGLAAMGYRSDKYRVVFFGRAGEVDRLAEHHPQLIPFLPLKIALFAQGEETLAVALDPRRLAGFFDDPALAPVLQRWAADLERILARVRAP
ncbi:DUF302 domain-containing protein [Inmirania thermothiophila]|uniref:Uncharacterized protein (DUF302 family) n=1 Tax=Inmirania thermothiophila TaxID=1750597 RepID=A0A3N1Y6G5_9GAMM|nr:DUF302 domain-containing protein [Inmirania thermothiophila]ROR34403.1 uncharacterized protein (DUF302 family) [Inmirania thermothiophila]